MNRENQINDIFRFVNLLPKEFVVNCVNKVATFKFNNRQERRNFKKLRSSEEKVKYILKDFGYRASLIEDLYLQYNDKQNFQDDSSYEEILESINASNCVNRILYMLHRCSDTNFNKKYFDDFIK